MSYLNLLWHHNKSMMISCLDSAPLRYGSHESDLHGLQIPLGFSYPGFPGLPTGSVALPRSIICQCFTVWFSSLCRSGCSRSLPVFVSVEIVVQNLFCWQQIKELMLSSNSLFIRGWSISVNTLCQNNTHRRAGACRLLVPCQSITQIHTY